MADEIQQKSGGKLGKEEYDELLSIQQSIKQIKEQSQKERVASLATKRVVGATCAATEFQVM
jgi:hypothetical protein